MIEFMLLGPPRSVTTWAANWLTTDKTLCLHDPLYRWHYSELNDIKSTKRLGVSCTGLFNFPDWVNSHPARKVIVHRPIAEVNESLQALGLPLFSEAHFLNLERINGRHVNWRELFDAPEPIYEYLLGLPFDRERHDFLRGIEMQPEFGMLSVNRQATKRLINEMAAAIGV